MKINCHVILRLFVGVSILGLFVGCVGPFPKERLADSSSDFNIVVEKAQNQMLLRNILRASRRYPIYFTSFNALRGNMQYNFSTGNITIPFSPWPSYAGAYSVAPSATYQSNPNFDLTVLDTQEFTRGIMTPVPMCTLDYYWKSGWPPEMLLHLFIQKMEKKNSKDEWEVLFDNYPPDEKKFKDFQDKIRKMKCKVESQDCKLVSPKVRTEQPVRPKDLIEARKADFEIITEKDGEEYWYQLKSKKTKYTVLCEGEETLRFAIEGRTEDEQMECKDTDKDKDKKVMGKIYLRSPEAIMYYLGEIVRREEIDPKFIPNIGIPGCDSPGVSLFLVRKSQTDSDAPVTVDFEGSKYFIPRDPHFGDRCRADQTMHVLSLISQLIGQQKKIEQVPVTGVVNVIGR